MIDVREIKLNMRYPDSRQEDITDAFTRGYTGAVEIGNKAIEKLEEENATLRDLVRALDWCTENFDSPNKCDRCPLEQSDKLTPECEVRMRELGIEVEL